MATLPARLAPARSPSGATAQEQDTNALPNMDSVTASPVRVGALRRHSAHVGRIYVDDRWIAVRAAGVRHSLGCGAVDALAASAPAGALSLRGDDQHSPA